MNALLEHIPTEMKRASGGEHAGPCPWCGGQDRFTVSSGEGDGGGLWWCRRCERGGDGIALLRELHGLTFAEACARLGLGHKVRAGSYAEASARPRPAQEAQRRSGGQPYRARFEEEPLRPPGPRWQEAAAAFVAECRAALCAGTPAARSARRWLHGRGLAAETIQAAGLGLNTADRWPRRTAWGLEPQEGKPEGGKLWLPRGVVIPWQIESDAFSKLWAVNTRRPNGDVEAGHPWKSRKYQLATGSRNALYGAGALRTDALRADQPAVIVEGELDALAVRQTAGDLLAAPLLAAVATGSTHGARRARWTRLLKACPLVLVAFDADDAGEDAARYWLRTLGRQALRWRPYWGDPAGMLEAGADVRAWAEAGLHTGEVFAREPEPQATP